MADRLMTTQAVVTGIARGSLVHDFTDHTGMTLDAIGLQDVGVAGLDADGFVEVLERKSIRVPEAVACFRQVFAHKIVRDVAVVAGCDGMMAGLLPTVVVFAHDMALHTGTGIVAEVGRALGIPERVGAQTEDSAPQDRVQDFRR